jgi:hypothetical protein
VTAALDTLLDHALVGYGYALRRHAWADDDPPGGRAGREGRDTGRSRSAEVAAEVAALLGLP